MKFGVEIVQTGLDGMTSGAGLRKYVLHLLLLHAGDADLSLLSFVQRMLSQQPGRQYKQGVKHQQPADVTPHLITPLALQQPLYVLPILLGFCDEGVALSIR